MSNINRRQFKRLRLDRSVNIPVQIYPKMPFIGNSMEATLNNISAGGMSILVKKTPTDKILKQGSKIKIHFRLPGKPLQSCMGIVAHNFNNLGDQLLGVRFSKLPKTIFNELKQMAYDSDTCDKRIREEVNPWCISTCSFYSLCRKPIRIQNLLEPAIDWLEMAFQAAE